MGKPVYEQKFRKEWKTNAKLNDWISETENLSKAFCKYCKCVLQCKYSDLLSHASTRKHLASKGGFLQQNKIPYVSKCTKVKKHEAALSLYFCQHGPIAPVDHMTALLKNEFQDSPTCQNIRLHRTKCSNIVKNILSVHFRQDLQNDIGKSPFSLLLDESTDIGLTKHLGVVIIYRSVKQKKIVSTFLSIIELSGSDSLSLVKSLKKELVTFKIDIKNLIGIGTDNANVMVGRNKSVYQELKKENPHLILVKCVCHSVQLAVNYACATLPRNLEFLVQETYNWFSKSSGRRLLYSKLYNAINNDKEPLNITRICETRWLSINVAVKRILNQWLELETHFGIVRLSERCYSAETLHTMYKDPVNFTYLTFLDPVISDMNVINMSFQSNTSDPTKRLNDLNIAINSLKNKICNPEESFKIELFEAHINVNSFLGYKFEAEMKKHREKGTINSAQESEIRHRCINFCVSLLKQLIQRLPENRDILAKIDNFSVSNIFQSKREGNILCLEHFGCDSEKILSQINNIKIIRWNNLSETSSFWFEVLDYEDSAGNKIFKELAEFCLQILCMPWSNAEVERVFSQLNITKSKLRNRLQIDMVNAILTVKYGLRRHSKCCFDYEVPLEYIRLIGSSETYSTCQNDNDIDSVWINID